MNVRKFMKAALKTTARGVLGTPVFKPVRRALSGRGTCLMYHRVSSNEAFAKSMQGFSPNRELAVSVDAFEKQIAHLAATYRCISLADGIRELKEGKLEEGSVMVTFDDGYRDNLTHALPVLKKYGVPATFYLTTAMIDGNLVPWWYEEEAIIRDVERVRFDWRGKTFDLELKDLEAKVETFNHFAGILKSLPPGEQREFLTLLRAQLPAGATPFVKGCEFLSWDDVATLAAEPLVTIGAHTRNHFVSSCLSEEEFKHEADGSRKTLEEKLGKKVDHFAYPFGSRSEAGDREFRMIGALGFSSAFTTRTGHLHSWHRDSLYSLPRIVIGCHDTVDDLKWKLGGFDSTLRSLGEMISA